ncbi:MAG TPA: hydroxymethylbilane synthase [candidate division Zixibacteria bacterium]|nr:hydroxymethylbilane synthase [candidate division Zixibacteria bacterium]MDD4917541.1 hydroxymethylbilane synthase [candidate division Zixibacteria bacterium]MDM7972190.1 hydroxymethylbilane synthase [candidate division Zixibacteria bacterium]HOD67720.1 hydroxymethylbilane synthase [candidate division Zixibacteria bacterium]HOZ06971.1 hydroxymethylbilane synthase [candidate division Zixibacteria bacterium]
MTDARPLIIGSRGSDLALWQAHFISDILARELGQTVEIKIIKTAGDRIQDLSFDKMEGKGFFTKEIEEALLAGDIDLAVHSLKDLMTTQPAGLKLAAAGYRADRRELLLIRPAAHHGDGLIPVREGSVIGTSSARRKCQIAFHRPSARIKDLRGNVPTRIAKLRDGQYDAIVLALAGVERLRLDLSGLVALPLDPRQFLPAPAQGILGIQIRTHDPRVEAAAGRLGSPEMMLTARVERGLLQRFGLGCSLPLGVYSERQGDAFRLLAVLGTQRDGAWTGLKRAEAAGPANDPEQIVEAAYTKLKE